MKIAFDVMGSDNGSKNAIIAASQIINEFLDVEIILVGKEAEIKQHLEDIYFNQPIPQRLTIYHAINVITMDTEAIAALRIKDSSMHAAINLIKTNQADGILTAGSTAAYLALCYTILGKIPGVNRPAYMATLPTIVKGKCFLLLDVGANIENTANDLAHFAIMADVYSRAILKISTPKIALANIGVEANKGTKLLKATYAILTDLEQQKVINFQGNIEVRDILTAKADIIVCDGYTGNIILKTLEGAATLIFSNMRQELTRNYWRKLAALLALPALKTIKNNFDYKNAAGAQLIGINGICFKTHGSSDVRSYCSALALLRTAILQDVSNKIKTQIMNKKI